MTYSKTFPAMRVVQPIGEFYVTSFPGRELLEISYTEIRAFKEGTQKSIAGIQRERNPQRVEQIGKYVNLEYATFPTSIIISVPDECVDLRVKDEDRDLVEITLSSFGEEDSDDHIPTDRIAFIIDGQHRVAGLEMLNPDKIFDVNVSIFVGASDADKAEIFARVNQSHLKVNRSLVVDLNSYFDERGPVKFAHEIVLALSENEGGPLFDKVKRLGKAEPGKGHIQTIAQATAVDPVVNYITNDPETERNRRARGIFKSRRGPNEWKRRIFQPFYDEDDDVAVFDILTNYFSAVEEKWPEAWSEAPVGHILNRTTGFQALMRFLRPVYLEFCDKGEILTRGECKEVFDRVDIDWTELNRDQYVPGSSGASNLYKDLCGYAGYDPRTGEVTGTLL